MSPDPTDSRWHSRRMQTTNVVVPTLDDLGLMRTPDDGAAVRGGVVALHGASLPQRDQPLFEHLARTITPFGYAVLSYDRRAAPGTGDTPLGVQADDALAATAMLAAQTSAPVGVFGFSQGAWAAALAASRSTDVTFLALVGCCGVSPAIQMRYYTDELLRRAGYDAADRANCTTYASLSRTSCAATATAPEPPTSWPQRRPSRGSRWPTFAPSCRHLTKVGTTWTTTRSRPLRQCRARPC